MDGAANTNYSSGSYLHKLNRNTLHAVPYKLDEGYSEDTRSQDDVAGAEGDAEPSMDERNGYRSSDLPLPDWILNMNEADRGGEAPFTAFPTHRAISSFTSYLTNMGALTDAFTYVR